MDWADGGASSGMGVERPLLRVEQDLFDQSSMPTYLELPEIIVSICPFGFRLLSPDWARRIMGLPGLIGRGRAM